MKIVFDLDGVIRSLMRYLHEKYGVPENPPSWEWKHNGKNIYQLATYDNFAVCREAPTTKYFNMIKKYYPNPEIWTHQPPSWQEATTEWINNHFEGECKVRFLTNQKKRERLDEHTDTILIEDSPKFSSYDRIILLDYPYNANIKAETRISKVSELEKIIKENING